MLWKRTQHGGLAVLEVTYNEDRQQWHPHLHVLTEGNYIPQHQLANAWLSITGDSPIVDVRAIKRSVDLARYLGKYLAKTLGASVLRSVDRTAEAIVALHGRRMIATWGDWELAGLGLSEDFGEWIAVGRLAAIVGRAAEGNATAILAVAFLERNRACRSNIGKE